MFCGIFYLKTCKVTKRQRYERQEVLTDTNDFNISLCMMDLWIDFFTLPVNGFTNSIIFLVIFIKAPQWIVREEGRAFYALQPCE